MRETCQQIYRFICVNFSYNNCDGYFLKMNFFHFRLIYLFWFSFVRKGYTILLANSLWLIKLKYAEKRTQKKNVGKTKEENRSLHSIGLRWEFFQPKVLLIFFGWFSQIYKTTSWNKLKDGKDLPFWSVRFVIEARDALCELFLMVGKWLKLSPIYLKLRNQ